MELYEPTVYRWCRQCGVAADDAADVCQEVFSSLASHIAQFRREKPGDSFRVGCGRLPGTRSRIISAAGQEAYAVGGSDFQRFPRCRCPRAAAGPRLLHPPADAARCIESWIPSVTEVEPASWEAFWRMTVQGHGSAEVAKDLGLTPSAVRQAKYRLLRRLRQELDG